MVQLPSPCPSKEVMTMTFFRERTSTYGSMIAYRDKPSDSGFTSVIFPMSSPSGKTPPRPESDGLSLYAIIEPYVDVYKRQA